MSISFAIGSVLSSGTGHDMSHSWAFKLSLQTELLQAPPKHSCGVSLHTAPAFVVALARSECVCFEAWPRWTWSSRRELSFQSRLAMWITALQHYNFSQNSLDLLISKPSLCLYFSSDVFPSISSNPPSLSFSPGKHTYLFLVSFIFRLFILFFFPGWFLFEYSSHFCRQTVLSVWICLCWPYKKTRSNQFDDVTQLTKSFDLCWQ